MHDLAIKNAVIYDGLGNPSFTGAVAVKDGVIAEIGADVGAAAETVDAGGMALAPGIVDIHTHFDAQLTWDPYATPSSSLGVTTVVIGNCGFTIAPCREEDRDIVMRNLTHVEGMSLEAMQAGIQWKFESFAEYMDMLTTQGAVPNVAAFVGHSSVRTYVMGGDASKRAATADEVAQMKQIVRDAMDAGAVGFATSTLEQHNGAGGVPMPSRLADDAEMAALTGALGEAGRGVFMLTKGMTSTIEKLEAISAANGRPVMIAAMFVDPGDPDRVFREIGQIAEARSRGRELTAQVGCFALGMEFTMRHPYPLEALIAWRPAIEAEGTESYRAVLADPAFRQGLKDEVKTPGVPNRFTNQWDTMWIQEVCKPENRDKVGRTVGDMAREDGKAPFDWFLDFGLEDGLDAMFKVELFNTDEDKVKNLLLDPNSTIALSDAGAHLSFLCDAGFGLHLFGHWARERRDMTLEQAVQLVTSNPADAYRLHNRGRLVEGAHADMILFDPATVGRGEKRRVNDLPTGASRLDTGPVGLFGTWVNGIRTFDENGIIGDCGRPGTVLRDFAD